MPLNKKSNSKWYHLSYLQKENWRKLFKIHTSRGTKVITIINLDNTEQQDSCNNRTR